MFPAGPTPTAFGLIAALRREVYPFLRQLSSVRRLSELPMAWRFQLANRPGIVAVSGMGADKARDTAHRLIEIYAPRLIISLGYGGAVNPDLAPGTVLLGQEYRHFDPGGPTLNPVCSLWGGPPVPELVNHLQAAGIPAGAGVLVSTPRIIAKHREAAPLLVLSNPVLDLETAAVAAVAHHYQLPFLGLRAITDTGLEEIPDFVIAMSQTAGKSGWRQAGRLFWTQPGRWPYLAILWQRSRRASRQLSRTLTTLLPHLGSAI